MILFTNLQILFKNVSIASTMSFVSKKKLYVCVCVSGDHCTFKPPIVTVHISISKVLRILEVKNLLNLFASIQKDYFRILIVVIKDSMTFIILYLLPEK